MKTPKHLLWTVAKDFRRACEAFAAKRMPAFGGV